jgi:hypothetical protein
VEPARQPKLGDVRTGRDGRTIHVENIGKRRPVTIDSDYGVIDVPRKQNLKPVAPPPGRNTAAQAQQAVARFAGAASDLKPLIATLERPEVSRLASLAAGVLGALLARMEGADAQEVLDKLQEDIEAVWKGDGGDA